MAKKSKEITYDVFATVQQDELIADIAHSNDPVEFVQELDKEIADISFTFNTIMMLIEAGKSDFDEDEIKTIQDALSNIILEQT